MIFLKLQVMCMLINVKLNVYYIPGTIQLLGAVIDPIHLEDKVDVKM